uniref:Uncharacterized protein n=1 Tax=uncultured marine virus TaxID=186617 RepID=S4TFD8_9VIRU|nr:hypothetical protein [uncultured marine virus]
MTGHRHSFGGGRGNGGIYRRSAHAITMARRTSNKIQPAELTLLTATSTVNAGASAEFTIDLSQCASLLNRRFYRQGLNWAVAGFKIITQSGVSGNVSVSKLPNTWVTSNAWEKAFRAWNKQQMEAIDDAGAESAVARFRDFKVFADVQHVTDGIANNLLPYDGSRPIALQFGVGEWEESLIVVPNVDGVTIAPGEYKLHMVGVNNNAGQSRGIIEGYADSRAYPQSPDPVSPVIGSGQNWLRDMFDVGNDNSEITENATDRNDNLPYPQVDYPGGEVQAPGLMVHDFNGITGTTIGGITRLKGGNFPCGLIRVAFDNTGDTSGNLTLIVDLVPGNHRGYLAEPMTEM